MRHLRITLALVAALALSSTPHASALRPGMPGLTLVGARIVAPNYVSINTNYGMWDGGSSRVVTFTGGVPTSVTVGGNAATITSSTSTAVTFTTPAASSESIDVVDVVLTNSTGSSTGTGVYTYLSVQYAARQVSAAKYSVTDIKYSTLNGSNVSGITDRGNAGYNFAQGTANLQPAYNATGGPNSRPELDTSSGKYMSCAAAIASGTGIWQGLVFAPVGIVSAGYVYLASPSNGSEATRIGFAGASGDVYVFTHDGTSSKNDKAGTLSAGVYVYVDGYITTSGGNQLTGAINGTPSGSPTALSAATQGRSLTDAYLGIDGGGNKKWSRVAFAFTIFGYASTDSMLTVERYFEERFGLTIATRTI